MMKAKSWKLRLIFCACLLVVTAFVQGQTIGDFGKALDVPPKNKVVQKPATKKSKGTTPVTVSPAPTLAAPASPVPVANSDEQRQLQPTPGTSQKLRLN